MAVERLLPGTKDWHRYEFEHTQRYRHFNSDYHDKIVLDLACGVGYGSHIISNTAKHVIAVDISSEAIEYAKAHYSASNIEFHCLDYKDLAQLQLEFDLVVSFETIEHVKDPAHFLELLSSSLKDQGTLICSSPNKKRFFDQQIYNLYHHSEMTYEEYRALFERYFVIDEQLVQNETVAYLRFQSMFQTLQQLNARSQVGLSYRFESFLRKMFNRPLAPITLPQSDLLNLGPGDMEILKLYSPTALDKTYILKGRLK